MIRNERGAALWIVLFCCFVIMFLITSVSVMMIKHYEMIQMRLMQMQATELVYNGIVFLQESIQMQLSFAEPIITIPYEMGFVEIVILEQKEDLMYVKITAYEESGGVQTYKVKIDVNTGEVIFYEKWGMSS